MVIFMRDTCLICGRSLIREPVPELKERLPDIMVRTGFFLCPADVLIFRITIRVLRIAVLTMMIAWCVMKLKDILDTL